MIHQNPDLLVHLLPFPSLPSAPMLLAKEGGSWSYIYIKLLEFFLKSSYFYITGLLMTFFVFIACS
jgi:hypothetical protein